MSDRAALVRGLDFSACKILLLGDLVLDRSIFGTTRRISREAPIPVVQYSGQDVAPGGAANVAANLASLGAHVSVAGLVGDDASGEELVHCLTQIGADTGLVQVATQQPTTVKTRIFAGGVGTVRQQVLRLDHEPGAQPDAATLERLTQAVRDAATGYDVVILSDYGYGAVPASLCAQLNDAVVVVDSRRQLNQFVGAHTLKPNLSELEGLVGRDLLTEDAIAKAAQSLIQQSEAAAVLVTLGRDGMLLCERDQLRKVPVFGDDEIADVTGAGDSVLAAYALSLAAGYDRLQAAHVATVAGAVAVNHYGTHAVRTAEMLEAVGHG